MNYYARLTIVILMILALAQFAPRLVNIALGLVLVSMMILQSDKYAALLAQLKL